VNVFWASEVTDDWLVVRDELARVFRLSRQCARTGESFVYVVHGDDLLGRRGPGKAMVATGLLSAARTAALEGWAKGWTANVIAWDGEETSREKVEALAVELATSGAITGELIHIGPGHVGKALA
jgi:hypothetical protein